MNSVVSVQDKKYVISFTSLCLCHFYCQGDQGLPGEQGAPGERGIGESGPKVRQMVP